MERILVTMEVEKAFDSLDYKFLISVLRKFRFGQNFISWIETILKYQESCVINGGTTKKYFKLNRGACQGGLISAYLFIIALEILFLLIKQNPRIKGLNIFDHCYADDTNFFLKDVNSIKETVNRFHIFSRFAGLRPILSKFEIAGIRVLRRVKVAVCVAVNELEKIQKCFLWENPTSRIKHDTLCNDYRHGGLKKRRY